MKKFIVKQDGKAYIVFNGRAIPINHFDKTGKPVVKVESEETTNSNGGKDVTVKIPCLNVVGKENLTL